MVTIAPTAGRPRRSASAFGPALAIVLIAANAGWGTSARAGERPATIRDILESREIGGATAAGLSSSPDGRQVAALVLEPRIDEDSYRGTWVIVSVDTGIANEVADAGDPRLYRWSSGATVTTAAKWSPDSRYIAYRRRDNGITRLWRTD